MGRNEPYYFRGRGYAIGNVCNLKELWILIVFITISLILKVVFDTDWENTAGHSVLGGLFSLINFGHSTICLNFSLNAPPLAQTLFANICRRSKHRQHQFQKLTVFTSGFKRKVRHHIKSWSVIGFRYGWRTVLLNFE